MIGLDVETTALTPEDGRLRLVQVAGDRGTVILDADVEDVRPLLEYVRDRAAVAHNANFEELWARAHEVELFLEDTMVMSRVLYGGTALQKRLRHGLADVAARELEIELDKEQQVSDWSGPLTEEQLVEPFWDTGCRFPPS